MKRQRPEVGYQSIHLALTWAVEVRGQGGSKCELCLISFSGKYKRIGLGLNMVLEINDIVCVFHTCIYVCTHTHGEGGGKWREIGGKTYILTERAVK